MRLESRDGPWGAAGVPQGPEGPGSGGVLDLYKQDSFHSYLSCHAQLIQLIIFYLLVTDYNTLTCAARPFVYIKEPLPYPTVIISSTTVSRDIVGRYNKLLIFNIIFIIRSIII